MCGFFLLLETIGGYLTIGKRKLFRILLILKKSYRILGNNRPI